MLTLASDEPVGPALTRASRFVRDHSRPLILGYFPVARINPFQALLYSSAHGAGVMTVGLADTQGMQALLTPIAEGVDAALHLHWTAPITKNASDQREAFDKVELFLREIHTLTSQGVRLVWTVHNILPHSCSFPEAEVKLRSALAQESDVIHIMNWDTVQAVGDFYDLPREKLLYVPHPSYLGAYPTHYSKPTARFELGFEPEDLLFGMVGALQPYKGLERFSDSLSRVAADLPRARGVVAGMPGSDLWARELVLELKTNILLRTLAFRLDDKALAQVVTALDVMVLPYTASLNSGAAVLASTFGVPIVAPGFGHFLDLEHEGLCRTYDPEEPDALTEALRTAEHWLDSYDPDLSLAYAESTAAPRVSLSFFNQLRERLK